MLANVESLFDQVGQLEADPWREKSPFSDDIRTCHDVLFDLGTPRREKIDALVNWLSENQPCKFGQMEAKQNRLHVCLLTENDLARGDVSVARRIADERRTWRRAAFDSHSHGFVIVLLSQRVANARLGGRGGTLHKLASRLCELYLGDGSSDAILHDDLLLKTADSGIWKWMVGANFFGSQGDKRWWHDHRFPGGIALSMNSIGHMARCRAELVRVRKPATFDSYADAHRERLVYFALPTAMRTIGPPGTRVLQGTWLEQHGHCAEDKGPPPYEDRPKYFSELSVYSENRYGGNYHTDQTIPSDYFDEGLWKTEDLPRRTDLAFTYLHSLQDEDYNAMGFGERFYEARENNTSEENAS